MKITGGKIDVITTYSGHYQPGAKNIYETLKYLKDRGVDISDIKIAFLKDPNLPTLEKQSIALPHLPRESGDVDISTIDGISPEAQKNI